MRRSRETRPLTIAGATFPRASQGEVQLEVGTTAFGERLHVPIRVIRGVRPGPRLVLVAGLRGDEVSAIQAVRELADKLRPQKLAGDVIAVPVVNVESFLHQTQIASARSRLSRSFPGDSRGPAPARHAHALFHEVVQKADLVVVLGAWPSGRWALPHVRTDLDAPGTQPLAHAFGAPLVVHDPGLPGELARAAVEVGRATIRYDLATARELHRDSIDGALAGLSALLRTYGMLTGNPPTRPPPTLVRRIERIRSQSGGIVELKIKPGELAKEGQPLAEIISPSTGERSIEPAPAAGLVIATTAKAAAVAGTSLVWLGRGTLRPPPPPAAKSTAPRTIIGWSEWVSLPDLGVPHLKAKVDTGARSCALHVRSIRRVGEDARGRPTIEFEVPSGSRSGKARFTTTRASVVEMVSVRDSGGKAERRPVIETTLSIGPVKRRVRVTLTDRGEMLFPMLVGRTGLGSDFFVDVGAKYRLGAPPKKKA